VLAPQLVPSPVLTFNDIQAYVKHWPSECVSQLKSTGEQDAMSGVELLFQAAHLLSQSDSAIKSMPHVSPTSPHTKLHNVKNDDRHGFDLLLEAAQQIETQEAAVTCAMPGHSNLTLPPSSSVSSSRAPTSPVPQSPLIPSDESNASTPSLAFSTLGSGSNISSAPTTPEEMPIAEFGYIEDRLGHQNATEEYPFPKNKDDCLRSETDVAMDCNHNEREHPAYMHRYPTKTAYGPSYEGYSYQDAHLYDPYTSPQTRLSNSTVPFYHTRSQSYISSNEHHAHHTYPYPIPAPVSHSHQHQVPPPHCISTCHQSQLTKDAKASNMVALLSVAMPELDVIVRRELAEAGSLTGASALAGGERSAKRKAMEKTKASEKGWDATPESAVRVKEIVGDVYKKKIVAVSKSRKSNGKTVSGAAKKNTRERQATSLRTPAAAVEASATSLADQGLADKIPEEMQEVDIVGKIDGGIEMGPVISTSWTKRSTREKMKSHTIPVTRREQPSRKVATQRVSTHSLCCSPMIATNHIYAKIDPNARITSQEGPRDGQKSCDRNGEENQGQ
jgi:hypothetical protein